MKVFMRTSILVAAAALASACTSTGAPWWTQGNKDYYTTPSKLHVAYLSMATPPAGVPDKVEGRGASRVGSDQ